MEVREEVPDFLPTVNDEVPLENSSLSWLQEGFEMPTEEEAMRALAVEISTKTPPLNNI